MNDALKKAFTERKEALRKEFRTETEFGGFIWGYDGTSVTRKAPDGAEQAMDFMEVPQTVLVRLFNEFHELIQKEAQAILARMREAERRKAEEGRTSFACGNDECNRTQAEDGLCRTCGSEVRPIDGHCH